MNSRTLLALFDSREKASAALRDLKARAFPKTAMDLLSREPGDAAGVDPAPPASEKAIAGLAWALIGCGMKQEQAEDIERAVRSGKTLITLDTERITEAICAITQQGGEIRANVVANASASAPCSIPAPIPHDPVSAQPAFSATRPDSNLPQDVDVPAATEDSKALFPPQPPQLLDADPALLFGTQAFTLDSLRPPAEPGRGPDSEGVEPGDLQESALTPLAAEMAAAAESERAEEAGVEKGARQAREKRESSGVQGKAP